MIHEKKPDTKSIIRDIKRKTYKKYSARRHGLQFIVVLPDTNLVMVFTGGAWTMAPSQAPVQYHDIIENDILKAIQ